jgi:hypothetical protein
MYECRCDERLKTKVEKSTILGYTGFLGQLEHLMKSVTLKNYDERKKVDKHLNVVYE